jgi:DUF971 family protein
MSSVEYCLQDAGRALQLRWDDGHRSVLQARLLRRHCRSAPAQWLRLDGGTPEIAADLVITGVQPVGHYGINLAFSDGHARGIYPFAYLRELADLPENGVQDGVGAHG